MFGWDLWDLIFEIIIPLVIIGSIFSLFALPIYAIFKIKKKIKSRKQRAKEISAAELLNNLANDMDEKLRQEIDEAVNEYNRKNNIKIITKEKIFNNRRKNSAETNDFVIKIREKLEYFSKQTIFFLDNNEEKTRTLNNYIKIKDFDNIYKKGKTELNNLSEKASDFLDKNEEKFRKIRDILKDNK